MRFIYYAAFSRRLQTWEDDIGIGLVSFSIDSMSEGHCRF